MKILPDQVVIENVLQCKMRGKVAYQSQFAASVALNLTYVKPFDHPSGKGYQRPVEAKRIDDFAVYLSRGDDALFTPVLLNAGGNWEFVSYDKQRPSFGRLFCKSKASLMDGQHRLGGIKRYIQETNSDLNIPFMAFHFLDEDEEIKFFDIINTKAKGIGTSLSKFLKRDSDEISWIATELITKSNSPFFHISRIIGKKGKGRHITLQNLYRTIHYFIKFANLTGYPKEEKLALILLFFNTIREMYSEEWINYKDFRLTHIVCLDALSIAGSKTLSHYVQENRKQVDYNGFIKAIQRLKSINWSVEGPFKYLKGVNGSKILSAELFELIQP